MKAQPPSGGRLLDGFWSGATVSVGQLVRDGELLRRWHRQYSGFEGTLGSSRES